MIQQNKPHIRIHYQQNDDIDHCPRDCAGNKFGCDLQFNSEKGVAACMNGSEPHVLWYELISGDINDLKKEKE